ncbi:MAG TPA: hypothetical protein VMI52_02050 [Acetobacteraceae bacterium]|nr:hypothetical protein [Acetobacteraceae bacterium]
MARHTDRSSAARAVLAASGRDRHGYGLGRGLGCLTLGALALTLPALAARATEQPATLPSRDVEVTYRVIAAGSHGPGAQSDAGDAPTLSQHMRYLAAASRLRVDPPGGGMFLIVDYRKHALAMVEPAVRRVLDLPAPAGMPFADAVPTARFVRQGTDTVAGLACTEWLTTDTAGRPTRTCLTPDGVLLRAESGGLVLAEAVSVSYAAQNPADFEVPAGFEHASQGK